MQSEAVAAIDEHGAKVQAMFTDIAPGYDRANRLMSLGIDVRWRRASVRSLLETGSTGQGKRLLDLCAGTLDSSLEMHRAFPDADIIGGDFSAGMLETGAKRLAGPARARITPRQMDAHQLPEPDASVDGIFCAFGVRNLSDLDRACAEKARVLVDGGRLVVLEFFRPETLTTRIFHSVYNNTVLPVVGWACTGNLEAYRYLPRSIDAFCSSAEYKQMLEDAGFEQVEISPLTFGVASRVSARRRVRDS
jgi:ubiquinone/menaquinone biosynthesis methyltransferase